MHPFPSAALVLALVAGTAASPFLSTSLQAAPNAASTASHLPSPPSKALETSPLKVLVFSESVHHLGLAGASVVGTPTLADASTFNALLASQAWDAVVVDSRSALGIGIAGGGWAPLTDYVNAGGRAVVSYWDWQDEPALASAFDVQPIGGLTWSSGNFFDSGKSPVFSGVTMPVSLWHDHAGLDGERFAPLSGAVPLAYVGNPIEAVLVRGNGGRTIAAPLFDEAGDVWLSDGSGIQLWVNMLRMVTDTEGPQVLVYRGNGIHHLAATAAFKSYPGTTHFGGTSTFDAMLQSQAWDAVLVDCPDETPDHGWSALIAYVNAGGRAVLSFGDWDNDLGFGDPALPAAFDVSVAGDLSWPGLTLFDSGHTDAFAGVTMPNSLWAGIWGDDGDLFTPVAPARGLGHVGDPQKPVFVWGNAGRTIAAPLLDSAGVLWIFDGSAVKLWTNLLEMVLGTEPACTQRTGTLGLNPSDYACVVPPMLGKTWVTNVSTTPLLGTATLSTFVVIGFGGPTQGIPVAGFELLILPSFALNVGLGTHAVAVPPTPLLAGATIATQGARIEIGSGGKSLVVLTNAVDVTVGS